jgi:hypothetical protein
MRESAAGVLYLLFLCLTVPKIANAHEEPIDQDFQSCKKIYFLQEQIVLGPQGIFVDMRGKWCETEALFADHGGIYILNLRLSRFGCPGSKVPCRWCERCVYEDWDICPFCGKPI